MDKFFFLWCVYATTLCVNCVQSQMMDCVTPDGNEGNCIDARQCTHIRNLLRNAPRPLGSDVLEKLKAFSCGKEMGINGACCPVDIMTHPNYNLLEKENCGDIPVDEKITNGNLTGLYEFPWMALIGYRGSSLSGSNNIEWSCGGSLIHKRYVLTAAHCIKNSIVRVRLGEHNMDTPEDCRTVSGIKECANPVQEFGIDEARAHEGYSKSATEVLNDIGLIRLRSEAELHDSVKLICLPVGNEQRNKQLDTIHNLIVTGWGVTEEGIRSTQLLKAVVPFKSRSDCLRAYDTPERSIMITERQMCAGGSSSGADSCIGDSGGPLQAIDEGKFYQFGIVSFGPRKCGDRRMPGVYTQVSKYLKWILDNMDA